MFHDVPDTVTDPVRAGSAPVSSASTSATVPPDWLTCTYRPACVSQPTRTTTSAVDPVPMPDVEDEFACHDDGTAGRRTGKGTVDAASSSFADTSTLGAEPLSTAGPPGSNEQPRVTAATTPTITSSTTMAPTMSRMPSPARPGGRSLSVTPAILAGARDRSHSSRGRRV